MYDLKSELALWKCRLDDLGIPTGSIDKVSWSVLKGRWGCCRHSGSETDRKYVIQISTYLQNAEYFDFCNTFVHELLHTANGAFNHGTVWKTYVDKVNAAYGLSIKRTESEAEKNVERPIKDYRYILRCKKCGERTKYCNICKTVRHPELYQCGICGGDLELETDVRLPAEVPVSRSRLNVFICSGCGQKIMRTNNSKFVREYAAYKCGICGGSFVKQLPSANETIDWCDNKKISRGKEKKCYTQ